MSEILLQGTIGFDPFSPDDSITARSVMDQLAQVEGDVTVRISSGGGDVCEGIDIMNALREHPGKVTVIVESLAASAASFIAVGGGDEVLMRPSSELMLHCAWTFVEGNADQVRKTLADLERQDVKLARIYAGKAGGEPDEWLAVMSEETWYTADEAVAAGLADGVVKSQKKPAPAPVARSRFKFANRAAAPPPRMPAARSESGGETTRPNDGQKEDTMNVLNMLAQELGREPEDVQRALSGFFNEEVQVNAPMTVAYPDDVEVIPTGKVEIKPTTALPEGLVPEVTVGDGFTADVGEGGVITLHADEGVAVDSSTDVVIKFGDDEVTVKATVVPAEKDDEDETSEDAPAAPPVEAGDEDVVTVPRAHLDYLNEIAKNFGEAQAKIEAREREERVDADIAAGRFAAANRSKALAALKRDPEAYNAVWGALPKGSIPRVEIGTSVDDEAPDFRSAADLRKLAESRLTKKETKNV